MAGNGGQAGEDPRSRDYAIIVGVTRYPELMRDGKPAHLQGSLNDAKKVREWIESDQGGGVPRSHVEFVVRAPATAEETADPTRDMVVKAFAAMYKRGFPNGPAGAPELPLGRRLYVYVSGHGLASDPDHGALLCSNSSDSLYATVPPYASIRAFRQAGFFAQFVVWFDGCMDWAGLEAEPINYVPRPSISMLPPGPVFTAYAAHPRLKAMEAPDENGDMSGVFTRTLLAGLKGDATDPVTGEIDGFCLQRYLFNAMPKYLPDSAKSNGLVDKQPLVRTDPDIVFGPKKVAAQSKVVLRFDAAHNGADARVWGRRDGQSLSLLDQQQIVDGKAEFALGNGVYAVDVPQRGLRMGFEVTGGAVTKLAAS